MFIFFEHQNTGTVTQDKTVTVAIPGATGLLRGIIAGRQRTGCRESGHAQRRGCHFSTARDHYIGITVLNHAHGVANVMGAAGAGGGDRNVRATEAVFDRHVARNHVDDAARHEERRYTASTAGIERIVGFFNHRQTADAGANGTADTVCIAFVGFNAGIVDGLGCSDHSVLNEQIHFARILGAHVRIQREILDRCREASCELRCVKKLNWRHTAFTGQDIVPGVLDGITYGCQQTETGHNNFSARHPTPPALSGLTKEKPHYIRI